MIAPSEIGRTPNMPRNSSGTLFILSLILAFVALNPSLSHAQVNVSPTANTGNTITQPNTSDNIAVASDGSVYVAWIENGTLKVARSDDQGQSFNSAVSAGSTSDLSVHLDTDGENVYLVMRAGETIFVSNDQGQSFDTRSTGQSSVFFGHSCRPEDAQRCRAV